jgi:hypothetical protein
VSTRLWARPEPTWRPLSAIFRVIERAPRGFHPRDKLERLVLCSPYDDRVWLFLEDRIPHFASAISEGDVRLYARVGAISSPFEQMDTAYWRHLEVIDWPNDMAVARDGSKYFSIHAQASADNILAALSASSSNTSRLAKRATKWDRPQSNWWPLRTVLTFPIAQLVNKKRQAGALELMFAKHVSQGELIVFARSPASESRRLAEWGGRRPRRHDVLIRPWSGRGREGE